MLDPFSFKFAIKFVDGDPSQNAFDLASTGDMTAVIIAAILAIVAATAGILYFARNRQSVMASAKSTLGNHVHMRGQKTSRGGAFTLLSVAIVAFVLSLITFVGSGTAQAIAEGQLGVPVVKAQVMDDGTVNINPIHLKNSHDTQIKVQSSRFETEAEAYFDEEMRAATCGIEGLGGTVYAGPAEGEYYYGNAYDRIRPGEAGDFNISITGLSAEKANSYLDQVVYVAEITFEDAVVPIPEGIEYVYDGKFHQGVEPDPDHYTVFKDSTHEDCVVWAQDVNVDADGNVLPYTSCVKLEPGFVWEDDTEDSIDVEWTINKATLTLHTESLAKDYDMEALVGSEGATVDGLIQEHELVNTRKTVPEYVGLEYTSITHYYEGLNEDEELVGKENVMTVVWDAEIPEEEQPSVNAKETNYEIVEDFGTLAINQIEFKHLENWFGEDVPVDGVDAPDQEYPYNAQEQGEPISYLTLEELSHETHPWILTKSDKYYDPTQRPDPYSPGPKTIVNVSESGEVQYVVESTVATDESGPHIGDYKTTIGKYNLTITPRELNMDELNLLYFNGDEPTEYRYRNNRYQCTGEDISVDLGKDTSPLANPTIQIKIGSGAEAVTDDFDFAAATKFFKLEGTAKAVGTHPATLTAIPEADDEANNYTGSLSVSFYIYAQTKVNYVIAEPNPDWRLWSRDKDAESGEDDEDIDPGSFIYSDEKDIIADFTTAPTGVNPYIITVQATLLPEGTKEYTFEATRDQFKFSVPDEDGIYPSEITVSYKATPSLTFTDETGLSIGDRPEEEGMAIYDGETLVTNYYSTIQYQVGSTAGEWQFYTTPKHYPLGTKLFRHEDCLVTSDKAYGDSDVTYFRVDLGCAVGSIDTTAYVSNHFTMNYLQIADTTLLNDETNVTYELTPNTRYAVKYAQEGTPDYQVTATIPWVLTDAAHPTGEVYTLNLTRDTVFPGTTITFAAPELPTNWNPAHGWDVDIFVNDTHKKVYPNDPTYTTLDYVTQIEVEPFALINLVDSTGVTPAATTFTCNVYLEGHKEYTVNPYVASAACGIYAPKGSSLIPDEGSKTKLNCFPEYFVFHDTDLIESFSGVDSMFEFIANPAPHYEFDGWDAAGYKVVYDETSISPFGDNPSYTFSVTSSLKLTHKLYWPEAYVSEATVDGDIITEQGTEVYEGSNVSLKVYGGTTGLRATFGVDIGDVDESNYNLLADEEAYQPFTFSMPSETNTTDCHVSAIPYRAMTFGEPILVDKTLDDVRFNLPTVQILDENSNWIEYDPETMKFPFDYIDKFVEDETVTGAIHTWFVENTSESRGYLIPTEIYIKVDGVDAAFDFNGWSLPTSNADVDATYKFKQKSADTLVKVECASDSFEGFTNPITITDQKGNVYNSAPEDPSNPTWNYAQITTESAPTDITVTGDPNELLNCKLKVEYEDASSDEINFTNGIATIPPAKINQNIKLTIEKPTPAGHTISLGSSVDKFLELLGANECECTITEEDSTEHTLSLSNRECTINSNIFDFSLKPVWTTNNVTRAINEDAYLSFMGNNVKNNFITSNIFDYKLKMDDYDLSVSMNNVDITNSNDIELQVAFYNDDILDDEGNTAFFYTAAWANDPSDEIKLCRISKNEDETWSPSSEIVCSETGVLCERKGKTIVTYNEINGDSNVPCIDSYWDVEGSKLCMRYAFWDSANSRICSDYNLNMTFNSTRYASSLNNNVIIAPDQYVFGYSNTLTNNNDSNGGGSYESPRFYDDGQDNGGGFEFLGDDTWAIQILRKFDLFHLFF